MNFILLFKLKALLLYNFNTDSIKIKVVMSIGVRGVFLQRGGISQASMLLACFNSAGGANAGL